MSPTRGILVRDPAAVLARHRALLSKSRQRRGAELAGLLGTLMLTVFAIHWLDISFEQIGPGLGELVKFVGLMVPPSTGGHLPLFLRAMGETLAIAFLGTLIAAVVAVPLSLLAASNTTPNPALRFVIRRPLDTVRGIDTLIWALVFVGGVGLGPFEGFMAIAVSYTGGFVKRFSEAIESTESRARDTVIAAGGNSLISIRFGLVPSVFPISARQVLYFFASHTRSATINGIARA